MRVLPFLSQGMWFQDIHCAPTTNEFDNANSRSIVTLGTLRGREDCVEMDAEHSVCKLIFNDTSLRSRNSTFTYTIASVLIFATDCHVLS